MTEQSPNRQFRAGSVLDGGNAEYIDQIQARFAADPNSADAAWAEFFRSLGESEVTATRAAPGAKLGAAVMKAIG